jgi:hypothetical protein
MGVYLRVDKQWQPWANTIAYYPLTSTSTTSDMSGNWYTLTQNWNSDFWTYLWVDCVYVHWSDSSWFKCLTNQSINNSVLWNTFTLIFRWARDIDIYCAFWWINWSWNWLNYGSNNRNIQMEVLSNWSINRLQSTPTTTAQQWNLYAAVYDNWSEKWYIDWNVVVSGNYTVGAINILWVWCWFWTDISWYTYQSNGYLSNVIIENKARTAQEVADYFDQTKANYWL